MQFNSIDFLIFFPIVLVIYFVAPKKLRNIWLLIASYYFYMSWKAKYAVLIGFSTVVTYVSGLLIDRFEKKNGDECIINKKMVLLLCIIINISILALFKYGNFALDSIDSILSYLNISTINRRFNIALPVGISFYTFQALGYIIDVYRGDIKAEKNFIKYALFVSFFPQLVAGPIERSKNLLAQINNTSSMKIWNARRVVSGAIMMVWGLFMKMVIADRISIVVDNVFDNYMMYGTTALAIAAIGFAIQIYCDFGSYSMIAIGAAKILGFSLMENFNSPYFAHSIKDFWNRWHISLSTWLRDYIYIPLGGNRKGKIRKYINLLIVFFVSGLWHGANWTYVAWGGLHGIYQIVGDITLKLRRKVGDVLNIKRECFSWNLLKAMTTFFLVDMAWVLFRSESITDACKYVFRLFSRIDPWSLHNGLIYSLGLDRVEMNILVVSLLLLIFVDLIRYKRSETIDVFLMNQNIWFEWLVIIGLIISIFVYGEYGAAFNPVQFLYFAF